MIGTRLSADGKRSGQRSRFSTGEFTHALIGCRKRDKEWVIVQWLEAYDQYTTADKAFDYRYSELQILPVETLDQSLMLLNGH